MSELTKLKPCNCEVHLNKEKSEPTKTWLPCLGHGIGCPCTELKNAAKNGEYGIVTPKGGEL